MSRLSVVLVVASIAVLAAPDARISAQQPDVAALVAAARQALGGDAALGAIASFTASGTFTRSVGPGAPPVSFEASCVLPDKFLRVSRRSMGGPFSFDITDYEGFNGDNTIRDTVAPNAPFPVKIPGPEPTTQQEIDARRAKALDSVRRTFIELAAPLFVTLPSMYGLALTADGQTMVGSAPADVIVMTRADGVTWRLLLDAKTHLPIQLSWRAKPIVTFSTSSVVSSRGGPPPPPVTLPSGDPTAGLADVEWVMTIRDYRVVDGVNWPRRFTTTYDGKAWEDLRVSRYRLNPKIDPKIFDRK